MGLRQRTAMGIIRQQRQNALGNGVSKAKPSRLSPRKKQPVFLSLDEQARRYLWLNSPIKSAKIQGEQALLNRLRETLQPLQATQPLIPELAQRECESLQDEISRLSRHRADERRRSEEEIIADDLHLPLPDPDCETQPNFAFRLMKISAESSVEKQKTKLTKLESAYLDLSAYREPVRPAEMSPPRRLNLVSHQDAGEGLAQVLLVDEQSQLALATAHLTQSSLQNQGTQAPTSPIHPKLVLSLLDS